MEKLVYVARRASGGRETPLEALAADPVGAAREAGGRGITILLPDRSDAIRERNPMRIGGDFDSLAAVLECWLPSLDARGPLEAALRARCDSLWGYLVTESTCAPCPHAVAEGERVPGITQWGINDKPAHVALEDFYREWQEVHSKLSFDLHPTRESYTRNAVARSLTPEAPPYLAIVLERFPSLDDFTDDGRYFGSRDVVKQMIEHVPSFYDFASAITGGMSEYRFG